jgi:hypothetical protein
VALNDNLVGKSYRPETFRLDADRVAAFRDAVGHPGQGVPPTIVTAPELAAGLVNVVGDPELGIDLSQVVHGEEEYVWDRSLTPGEQLTAQATIEDIRTRGGLGFLTLRTDLRDEKGRTVVTARSTLIVRGGS